MFTGLVEEIGHVQQLHSSTDSMQITIRCSKVVEQARIGDSIMTNGVCLTAIEIGAHYFIADVMHESLKRSTLGSLTVGSPVNLEKSLTLQTFLGGHLVTGDVDCQGQISHIVADGIAKIYSITPDNKELLKFIVDKGRISIDGASLTVMQVASSYFSVSLIPHTLENIIMGDKNEGDKVNLEFDLIAKHIEKLLNFNSQDKAQNNTKESTLTLHTLLEQGFM